MANPNRGGLWPAKNQDSGPYNAGITQYSTAVGDAVAIFIGDLVTLVGTSQTINDVTYQDVAQSVTGGIFTGVVVGVLADTRDSPIYRAASTQRILLVADNPNVVFEAQDIGTGTPLALADIGLNINVVVGAGSTTTGISGMELNNGTEAGTNTLDLKIVGFVNRPDNVVGVNAKYLVRINRHRLSNQVAGV